MRTYIPSGGRAEELSKGNNWFVLDADGAVLGRLATRVASLLMGKDKPEFTPHVDCGDHVVIINAAKIVLTGRKIEQKVYYRHSGYPGGLRETGVKKLLAEKPDVVIREAILGMLPKNKLRAHRAKKLRIYKDAKGLDRHSAQKPQPLAV